MSVPFSNTKLRVPQGFMSLLEDFTREILREQPDDIFIFGAKYFQKLISNANVNNPSMEGGYEEEPFSSSLCTNMTGTCMEKINEAARIIQKDYKMLKSTNNRKLLSRVSAAIKIQRVFRGYRVRKYLKAKRLEDEAPAKGDIGDELVKEDTEQRLSQSALRITSAFLGVAERDALEESSRETSDVENNL